MPSRRFHLPALASACVGTLLAAPGAGAAPPPGFSLVPVATGLTEPTAHAYAPDGRVFVTERAGRVLVQRPGLDASRSVFLDIRDQVNTNGERGLLGIVLDPQFTTRPRVFLFLTAERNPAAPDGAGASGIEVWRFSAASAGAAAADPATKAIVLRGPVTDSCCHYGGTVRFDGRGRLLAAFGDTADQRSAQRAGILNGRLVRIDPETGNGSPENPFYDPLNPSSVMSRTLATGFRNPFRFTVDPLDEAVWVGDVGQNTWEEIDRVPASGWQNPARDTNFGWPCFEGSALTASAFADASWTAMCSPIAAPADGGTGPGAAAPVHSYAHAAGQGASVTGGPIIRQGSYPAAYAGRVIAADYSQDRFFTVGVSGGAAAFGTPGGFDNPVDIAMDPNGDVSYAAIGGGAIRSITWTAGNRTPQVTRIGWTHLGTALPVAVRFSADATDADGDPLTYTWELGDGAVLTGRDVTHTYTRPISTDVILTVSDGRRGGIAVAATHVDIGNTAPAVRLGHTVGADGFRVGENVRVQVQATDAEEGSLGPGALSWRATRVHLDHRHPVAAGPGATGAFDVEDHGDDPGRVELVGRAADAYGAVSEATVTLQGHRVRLVAAAPEGAGLVLDGARVVAPHTWDSIVGGRHVVVAPNEAGGLPFSWWQHGATRSGERTFEFETPAAPARIVAEYGGRLSERAPTSTAPAVAPGRPLRATARRSGAWIVVRARPGRSGRLSIVVAAGSRRLGACLRLPVAAGAATRCRVRSVVPTGRRVTATVVLRTDSGRHTLRVRVP